MRWPTAAVYRVGVRLHARSAATALVLAWLLALPMVARGQSALYAVDGASGGPSTLYRLDPRDGSVLQTIGPVGFDHVTGLAFHPVTGVLYGVSRETDQLLTIDPATGAGTVVGTLGLAGGGGGGVPDMAFAPSGQLYVWSEGADDLALVDVATGAGSVVGECGFGSFQTGLAIDEAGSAWMKSSGQLYTVDRVTGACTPGASLTGSAHNILDFDEAGRLYTAERVGGTAVISTVDPATGVVTPVGSNAIATLSALAFEPPPRPPLFAVDGASGTASTLYRLDPRDGSVLQTIGSVGFNHVTGLAFHPVTGVLYAVSRETDQLLTIDPATGAGTVVGTLGLAGGGATGIPDLAFAPSGQLYVWSEGADDLAEVNVATGAGSVVGDCGFGTAATGLAIDEAGRALMKSSGQLYFVDRVTGACTPGAFLTGSADSILAYSPLGTFYTADRQGGTTYVATVDSTTGVVTTVGSNAIANLSALAFKPPPLPPLYAVDGASGTASTLYRLDPRNGSVLQTIGPVGFTHVTGLAFHPVTGVLYGVSRDADQLLTIDPATGAGTAVGTLGLAGGGATGVPDMGFAPSGQLYVWSEGADDLAEVNVVTGAGSVVGDCGVGTSSTGLAIDEASRAWMKSGGALYLVNRVTGACTPGAFLTDSPDNILAYSSSGTLYSAERQGGTTNVVTVDSSTGVVTAVGSNAIANLSALAFKPPRPSNLYAADGAGGLPSTLSVLDPGDGSLVAELGPIGFLHVTGLAFHPVTGVLYGVSRDTDQLLTIDPATGAGTAVGTIGLGSIGLPDMAFAPSGQLYVWTESGDDLGLVDVATGAGSVVGDCGFGSFETGLAIDEAGNAWMKAGSQLYTVDRVTGACTPGASLTGNADNILAFDEKGQLFTADRQGGTTVIAKIDATSGSLTPIGSNQIASLSALAFEPPPLPPLYAADGSGGTASTLYRLDPRDGSLLQTIGPIGFTHVTGLAFQPVTGVLFGVSRDTDQLLTIDRLTGAGTAVGTLGLAGGGATGIPDLAFAPSGRLYVWSEGADDLAEVNVVTGAGSVVGDCGFDTFRTGLAVDEVGQMLMKSDFELYRVDRLTGACTPGALLTGSADSVLAYAHGGAWFTADRQFGTTDIATADPTTGALTLLGSNAIANLSALTFERVPEPTATTMLVAGIGGLLALARRRRRAAGGGPARP